MNSLTLTDTHRSKIWLQLSKHQQNAYAKIVHNNLNESLVGNIYIGSSQWRLINVNIDFNWRLKTSGQNSPLHCACGRHLKYQFELSRLPEQSETLFLGYACFADHAGIDRSITQKLRLSVNKIHSSMDYTLFLYEKGERFPIDIAKAIDDGIFDNNESFGKKIRYLKMANFPLKKEEKKTAHRIIKAWHKKKSPRKNKTAAKKVKTKEPQPAEVQIHKNAANLIKFCNTLSDAVTRDTLEKTGTDIVRPGSVEFEIGTSAYSCSHLANSITVHFHKQLRQNVSSLRKTIIYTDTDEYELAPLPEIRNNLTMIESDLALLYLNPNRPLPASVTRSVLTRLLNTIEGFDTNEEISRVRSRLARFIRQSNQVRKALTVNESKELMTISYAIVANNDGYSVQEIPIICNWVLSVSFLESRTANPTNKELKSKLEAWSQNYHNEF